jgi:hypothetical protein
MRKKMNLDVIYSVCQAWSSVNPVPLVRSRRKLLPDLEGDDLQGFSNKEISKSEILDMVCAIRSSENIDEDTLKNGYRVMCVKSGLPAHDRQTLSMLP